MLSEAAAACLILVGPSVAIMFLNYVPCSCFQGSKYCIGYSLKKTVPHSKHLCVTTLTQSLMGIQTSNDQKATSCATRTRDFAALLTRFRRTL